MLPDLIFVDGHGVRTRDAAAIATPLGVLIDVPTTGCAKSLSCSRVERELGEAAGARALPVYVSTRHRISLD